jgi:hypothetical protein
MTQTTDAPLDVAYVSAPLDSILRMDAKTSNAPAMVQLHSTYEGDVALKTTYIGDIDVRNVTTTDPSGGGRERTLSWGRTGRSVMGSLVWDSPREETGSVSIASDAEIHLRV